MTHSSDWTEPLRRWLWPLLHGVLTTVGAYSVGYVGEAQYAGTAPLGEEELEKQLHSVGFRTNVLAALKHDGTGEWSEKSCVWRESLLADRQLHVTLFDARDGTGMDVYAHWEWSWITHPIRHVRAKGVSAEKGVRLAREKLAAAGVDLDDRHRDRNTSASRQEPKP